jgi:hypothetical protein
MAWRFAPTGDPICTSELMSRDAGVSGRSCGQDKSLTPGARRPMSDQCSEGSLAVGTCAANSPLGTFGRSHWRLKQRLLPDRATLSQLRQMTVDHGAAAARHIGPCVTLLGRRRSQRPLERPGRSFGLPASRVGREEPAGRGARKFAAPKRLKAAPVLSEQEICVVGVPWR